MWLDELVSVAETLRSRIEMHGAALRRNEAATRYALIDPVLRALGWDIEDPAQVVPEFVTAAGRADYALRAEAGKRPVVMIEAKSLDTKIGEKEVNQAIHYAHGEGSSFCVLTDGEHWRVYDVWLKVPHQEKLILEFGFTQPVQVMVMQWLWLWRGNLQSDKPGSPLSSNLTEALLAGEPRAQSAISVGGLRSQDSGAVHRTSTPTGEAGTRARDRGQIDGSTRSSEVEGHGSGSPRAKVGETTLRDFDPKKIDHPRPPRRLVFPDGASEEVPKWLDLQGAVIRWLVASGHLDAARCPIRTKTGLHVVHSENLRHDGRGFNLPKSEGAFWFEGKYASEDHARNARVILLGCGVNPEQVRVVLD